MFKACKFIINKIFACITVNLYIIIYYIFFMRLNNWLVIKKNSLKFIYLVINSGRDRKNLCAGGLFLYSPGPYFVNKVGNFLVFLWNDHFIIFLLFVAFPLSVWLLSQIRLLRDQYNFGLWARFIFEIDCCNPDFKRKILNEFDDSTKFDISKLKKDKAEYSLEKKFNKFRKHFSLENMKCCLEPTTNPFTRTTYGLWVKLHMSHMTFSLSIFYYIWEHFIIYRNCKYYIVMLIKSLRK